MFYSFFFIGKAVFDFILYIQQKPAVMDVYPHQTETICMHNDM